MTARKLYRRTVRSPLARLALILATLAQPSGEPSGRRVVSPCRLFRWPARLRALLASGLFARPVWPILYLFDARAPARSPPGSSPGGRGGSVEPKGERRAARSQRHGVPRDVEGHARPLRRRPAAGLREASPEGRVRPSWARRARFGRRRDRLRSRLPHDGAPEAGSSTSERSEPATSTTPKCSLSMKHSPRSPSLHRIEAFDGEHDWPRPNLPRRRRMDGSGGDPRRRRARPRRRARSDLPEEIRAGPRVRNGESGAALASTGRSRRISPVYATFRGARRFERLDRSPTPEKAISERENELPQEDRARAAQTAVWAEIKSGDAIP